MATKNMMRGNGSKEASLFVVVMELSLMDTIVSPDPLVNRALLPSSIRTSAAGGKTPLFLNTLFRVGLTTTMVYEITVTWRFLPIVVGWELMISMLLAPNCWQNGRNS